MRSASGRGRVSNSRTTSAAGKEVGRRPSPSIRRRHRPPCGPHRRSCRAVSVSNTSLPSGAGSCRESASASPSIVASPQSASGTSRRAPPEKRARLSSAIAVSRSAIGASKIACPRVARACLDADRALTDCRRKRRRAAGCRSRPPQGRAASGRRAPARSHRPRPSPSLRKRDSHIAAKHFDPKIRAAIASPAPDGAATRCRPSHPPAGRQSLRPAWLMKTSRTSSRSR